MRCIPLVAFTLAGPMAHFRKFYTTTSALTYLFPPRTTLMGLVAGMLGRGRDRYYEELSAQKLWIAVRMLTPVRKRFFTVNYLFTKDNKLYDRGRGTQIPVEWILAKPPHRVIRYRIYLSSPDERLMKDLRDCFERRKFVWPVYLGVSEALGWVEDEWIGETSWKIHQEPVLLGTPVLHTQDISLKIEEGLRLLLDRITQDFVVKPYRSPVRTVVLLFEAEGKPFRARVSYPVFELPDLEGVFGGFMHEISFPPGQIS